MKPFLKWIGGKTQILDKIIKNIPNIENYVELFVGGGSVFIGLLNEVKEGIRKINNFFINDKNQHLIDVYTSIQDNVDELMKELDNLNKFNEKYYYEKRTEFNTIQKNPRTRQNIIRKSALFIYLNKTCFRGMYRESKNGFNVPYGNYKNPTIYEKDNLITLHKAFNEMNIKFSCCDFWEVNIPDNSFVYMDPPYYPLDEKSFVQYTKSGFGSDKFQQLIEKTNEIAKENMFLRSDSFCVYNIDNYDEYYIEKILCKRSINSKNPGSKCYEVLIGNFEFG